MLFSADKKKESYMMEDETLVLYAYVSFYFFLTKKMY